MNTSDLSVFASFTLDERLSEPLYRQLYGRIRDAVLSRHLAPGSRLPSSRALATELGLARGTVALAYELLESEGFVIGQGAAGTRVNTELPATPKRTKTAPTPVAVENVAAQMPVPLRMGLPALDLFPRKLWSRLVAGQARQLPVEALDYGEPQGLLSLRRSIAAYLGISRGIACDPGQVFITAGYQGALRLISTVLLKHGEQVWCEDPGYFRAREAVQLVGAEIVPVPLDEEGLMVERGIATAPKARLALVTPSHQAPLGMTLSLPRRLALLEWAAQNHAWVVEDDYDGEFRYIGRPLPALKSLDGQGRVLYAGTFSKVLFPGLLTGYLVVPDALVESFTQAANLTGAAPSQLTQRVISSFIDEGHFTRHIRRMRAAYAERRTALAEALQCHTGDRMRLELQAGGMHLLGWLDPGWDDMATMQSASAAGLMPHALSPWAIATRPDPALMMSFTNIAVEQADQVAARVAQHLCRKM